MLHSHDIATIVILILFCIAANGIRIVYMRQLGKKRYVEIAALGIAAYMTRVAWGTDAPQPLPSMVAATV